MSGRPRAASSNKRELNHESWLTTDHSLADYIRMPSTSRYNAELPGDSRKKVRSSSKHLRPSAASGAPLPGTSKHSSRDRSASTPVVPSVHDSSAQYQNKAPSSATPLVPTASSNGRNHDGNGDGYNLRNYLKKRADKQSPRSSNEKVVYMEDDKALRPIRQSRSQAAYATTTFAPHGASSTQTYIIPLDAPFQPPRDPTTSRAAEERDKVKEKEQRKRQKEEAIVRETIAAAEIEAERERLQRRAAREKDRAAREREKQREKDRLREREGRRPVDTGAGVPPAVRLSRPIPASVPVESQADRPRPPRSRRGVGTNGQESGMSSSEQEMASRERRATRRHHHPKEPTVDAQQSSSEGERAFAREQRKLRRTHDDPSHSGTHIAEGGGHDHRVHTKELNYRSAQTRESPLQRPGTAPPPSAAVSTSMPLSNASQPTPNGPADPQTPRLHPRSGTMGASIPPDVERPQLQDILDRSQPASGQSQGYVPQPPHKSHTYPSFPMRGDIGSAAPVTAVQDMSSAHEHRQQWQTNPFIYQSGNSRDVSGSSNRVGEGIIRPPSAKPNVQYPGQVVEGFRSRGDGIVRPPSAAPTGHRSGLASTNHTDSRSHGQDAGYGTAQAPSSSRPHPSPAQRPGIKVEESPRTLSGGTQHIPSDRERGTLAPSAPFPATAGPAYSKQNPPSQHLSSTAAQDPRSSDAPASASATWMQSQHLPDNLRTDVKLQQANTTSVAQAVVNVAVVQTAMPPKPGHSHSPSHGAQPALSYSPGLHPTHSVNNTPRHSPSARLPYHRNGSNDTIHVPSQKPSPLNPTSADLPHRSSATSLRPNGTPRAETTTMPRTATATTGYPDSRYRSIPTPTNAAQSVSVSSHALQSPDPSSSRMEPPAVSNYSSRNVQSSHSQMHDPSFTTNSIATAKPSPIPSVPLNASYSSRTKDFTFTSSENHSPATGSAMDSAHNSVRPNRSISSPPPPTQVRQQPGTGISSRTAPATSSLQPIRNNAVRSDVPAGPTGHSRTVSDSPYDAVPRRTPTPGHGIKAPRGAQEAVHTEHADTPPNAGASRGAASLGPPPTPPAQSSERSYKEKEAKKRGGIFGLLRSFSSPPKQEARQVPSAPIFGRKRLNSNPTQPSAFAAEAAAPQPAYVPVRPDTTSLAHASNGVPLRAVESAPPAPTRPPDPSIPVPIAFPTPVQAGGRNWSPSKGMPYRLVSRRHRTVSAASVGAVDGSVVNTVLTGGESTRSSTVGRPSPPLRDPVAAANEWRTKEETEFAGRPSNRRRRPGVVFDVEEDPEEDSRPPRRPVPRRQQTVQAEA